MKKQSELYIMKKYQWLLKNSQELILFFDESGSIVECNQSAKDKLGYGEEMLHIPIMNIFRKAMKKEKNRLVIDTKHINTTEETVAYRKNQTCMEVSLRITIHSNSQEFLGLCTAVNTSDKKDAIRELKQIKDDLKSSSEERNEFVANITHELRTPVNGIMGLTNYLLETELMPKQVETVNIIHRCCTNMNTIINDLLDYTKMANNKLVLQHKRFYFRRFIDNIIAVNSNSISEKGLKLIVNVADDIPERLIGDEFRLTQIVNNLLSNAVKFTSIGQVALEVVKLYQNDTDVELFFMVMDTGIGISLEEKDKLFQSFTQVDSTITKRFGGTGLGLSISKMLVEAMQGSITVESEKDQGSTFSFTVHLEAADEKEEFEENESMQADVFSSNKDSENSSEYDYLSRMLEEASIESNHLQTINIQNDYENPVNEKKTDKNLTDMMEKLVICIEMESWEKAEDYAASLKKLVTKENHKAINNKALCLVLAVRKEEHDASLQILEELKEIMNGEKQYGNDDI